MDQQPGKPQASTDDYKPDLATLKKEFQDSQDLTDIARRQAAIDEDYYDGPGQWTREERAALKARKQPDNYFNMVRRAVNGALGVIRQGNTDPRAYPRTPQDEDSADVASKSLRYAADAARFDDLKLDAARNYLVPGTCAAIVEVDEDRKVVIEPIRFEEHFYDPRARRLDFKDARYQGIAKWRWADDVAAEYPDHKTAIDGEMSSGAPIPVLNAMEDRPSDAAGVSWVDQKKRRIMVVEIYRQDRGQWWRCVYYSGGILACGPSPYLDEKRRPCCPIEARSCYIDRENNRYGYVRDMRGPQDEINKRSSKLLHRLSTNLVQENQPGALMGVDADLVRKEAARPDGVLPSGVQIVPTSDKSSGEAALLQEAKAWIERMGPSPDMLGRQTADSSGRAQLIRQQAGMTELAIVFGGMEEWELRIYRQMWNRMRQYWTAPMFVRVTDDEGAPEFVQLNKPVPGPPQVVMGQDGVPTIQPTILGYENAIAELDVDIILDSVPDTANVQAEQFAALMDLAKLYGPQEVPFDDVLKLSSLQGKRELLEARKARQEQSQPPGPMQELQIRGAMAEVAGKEAEVGKTQAETALTEAKARNEALQPMVDAHQREMDAIRSLGERRQPAAGV